jgi:hypothetical protein
LFSILASVPPGRSPPDELSRSSAAPLTRLSSAQQQSSFRERMKSRLGKGYVGEYYNGYLNIEAVYLNLWEE